METKKTSKAALENKKGIFLQIGFITVLSMVLIAFEWTSEYEIENTLGSQASIDIDIDKIDVTYQKEKKLPPPPPAVSIDELLVVKDNVDDLENEIDIEDTGIDPGTIVNLIPTPDEDTEPIPFIKLSEKPKFNGEEHEEFRKFIRDNVKYPEIARQNGVQGRVFIQFVVNSKGKVVNAIVARGVDPALDAEALRVISSSPLWTPGMQSGKAVNVQFTFPVLFVLR